MKLISFTLLALLATAANAAPDHSQGAQIDTLITTLELTDTQADQVEQILREQGTKRREAMQSMRRGDGNARATMEALREETEVRLGGVLDDSQMTRFRELAAEQREQMREGRGRRGAGSGAAPGAR